MKETLKEAGLKYICKLEGNGHLLENEEGLQEVWFNNKNHASYGLKYKNTHLEYARTIPVNYDDPKHIHNFV